MRKRRIFCRTIVTKSLLIGLVSMISLMTAAGCGDSQKASPSQPEESIMQYSRDVSQIKPILGRWTAESVTVGGKTYTIAEYSELKRENISNSYTLREDGTVALSFINESVEGTYTFDGTAVEALFGASRYRLVYDADQQTLTRTKESTDEVLTYRRNS